MYKKSILIYVPTKSALAAIVEASTPEERGKWLLDGIRADYLKCPICGMAMFECPHMVEIEEDVEK